MPTLRDAVQLVAAGWPQSFTPEQATVYLEMLADVPPDELTAAVRRLISTSDFRPSVAAIRTAVLDGRGVAPSPAEAAEQAAMLDEWAAARAVPWGAQEAPPAQPTVHPAVLDAWTAAGADAFPAVFLRAYREARQRYVDDLLALPLDGPAELTA